MCERVLLGVYKKDGLSVCVEYVGVELCVRDGRGGCMEQIECVYMCRIASVLYGRTLGCVWGVGDGCGCGGMFKRGLYCKIILGLYVFFSCGDTTL